MDRALTLLGNTSLKKVNKQITIANKLLAKIDPILIPYRKGDKWGFCTWDKKIAIDCVYDFVTPFNNGRAMVWLFEDGSFYDWARFPTENAGSWGIIDKTGKQIIPCIYDRIEKVPKGFLCSGYIEDDYLEENWDEELKQYFGFVGDFIEYIDINGKLICEDITTIKNCIQTQSDSKSDLDEKYQVNKYRDGFIDKNGKEILLGNFDEVSDFKDGFAYVWCLSDTPLKKGEKYRSKWQKDDGIVYHLNDCYIDKNGTQYWED